MTLQAASGTASLDVSPSVGSDSCMPASPKAARLPRLLAQRQT